MSLFPLCFGYGTGGGGGGSDFDLSLSSTSLYGSRKGPGTVTSELLYVSPAGGAPPYTYLYEQVDGDLDEIMVIQSGNTVRFALFMPLYPSREERLINITVTDVNGATGVVENYLVALETRFNSSGEELAPE